MEFITRVLHLTGGLLRLATSSSYGYCELNVIGNKGYFYGGDVAIGTFAVRPLVCIPTSVFNSDYASTLVNG